MPLLALVGILPGNTSVAAIAPFGRLRARRLGHALGFRDGKMPCANTVTNLLARLDPDHLDRLIGAWLADRHADGWDHLALDGKTVRGRRDGETATSRRQGHGRIERRTITTSTWRNEYPSGWPKGVAGVPAGARADGEGDDDRGGGVRVHQPEPVGGRRRPAAGADAGPLGIGNGLNHTRDETFREDRCRVRRGTAPRVLASRRNVAVSLLRNTDHPSMPAATRERAAFPDRALDMLNAPPSISE